MSEDPTSLSPESTGSEEPAGQAQEAVGQAQEAAGQAQEAAGQAQEAAGQAQEAAGQAQEAAGQAQEAAQAGSSTASDLRRSVVGTVVADGMDKTVTVSVRRRFKHPRYGKYITRSSKLHVHDENNECKVGDVVSFVSCRPLSKTKSWKLVRIVNSAG